jgi:hypothetical protein
VTHGAVANRGAAAASKPCPMNLEDLPNLEWSSTIREAMHADAALQIAGDDQADQIARAHAEGEALTYFYVAWVVEGEWFDGSGAGTLAVSGDVFLAELWRQHDLGVLDRPTMG